MYSKKISVSSVTAIVLVVSHLVDEALSIKCYICESYVDEHCYTDPKTGRIRECGYADPAPAEPKEASANVTIQSVLSKQINFYDPARKKGDEDCGTLTGYFGSQKYVSRVCLSKLASCRFYEKALAGIGFETESCDRCYTDLCNSSNNLVPAILTLATLLLFVKQ